MKIARAAGTGATLLLMVLGTFAIAGLATAAIIGILYIGAVYSWIALIPVLVILVAVNDALSKAVARKRRELGSPPAIAAETFDAGPSAAAAAILTTIAIGTLCLAAYHMAQVTGWWPIAIIAIVSIGLAPVFDPPLPHEDAERARETATIKEAVSKSVLASAARYRSERPDATSRS